MGGILSNRRADSASGKNASPGGCVPGLRDNTPNMVLRGNTSFSNCSTAAPNSNSPFWERRELEPSLDDYSNIDHNESFDCRHFVGRNISSSNDLVSYLIYLLGNSPNEIVYAFFLDSDNCLRWHEHISTGSQFCSTVNYRSLVCTALRLDARAIILGHNHPSGQLRPSAADVSSTLQMQRIFKSIGISIFDHIIVSSKGFFSFKEEKIL